MVFSMKKYEYRTYVYTLKTRGILSSKTDEFISDFSKQLNDMGSYGWELVEVIPLAYGDGWTGDVVGVFKREYSSVLSPTEPIGGG